MKLTFKNHLRNLGSAAFCLSLLTGVADAKPDKGKDKSSQHSKKDKGAGKKNKHSDKHGEKDAKKAEKEFRKDLQKEHKEIDKDLKNARKDAEKHDKEIAKWREKRFRDDDRAGVIHYFEDYRDKDLGLPPGLAKKYRKGKKLPKGWEKKIHDGYVIEEDWNEHFYPMEYADFPGLERVPDTRLYLYGNRIVRVYEPRREVIDMILIPSIRFD